MKNKNKNGNEEKNRITFELVRLAPNRKTLKARARSKRLDTWIYYISRKMSDVSYSDIIPYRDNNNYSCNLDFENGMINVLKIKHTRIPDNYYNL